MMPKRMLGMFVGTMMMSGFQSVSAQVNTKTSEEEVTPLFFFDAMSYSSDQKGKSRIDFYVQVPYNELRFVKEGDQFVARYDVTLNLENPNRQVLDERTWSVDVRAAEIEQTTSGKLYSLTQRSIDADPGSYRISVQVKDQDSRKTGKVQRALLVTDYEKDSLSLSDIMLVSRLTTSDGGKRRIVPNIKGSIATEDEAFFLFFEAYSRLPLDSIEVTWKIFDEKKQIVKELSSMEALAGTKTQSFVKVDSLGLPVGTYLMTIEARPPRDSAGSEATTSRAFSVRWTDIPVSVTDIDKAVEEMRYIADPADFDYIRAATTPEEKRKRFVDFWTKRDPDPSTPRNELMEEYYRRVEYCNKHFSHYLDGWKTDMGMVYIRFGPPENVERHPFDMNTKPYEVWYYYQQERQFIFVDETGFGDYRLSYPTTDLWGRVR